MMIGFVVPVILVSFAMVGIGRDARLVVKFPEMKEVKTPSLRVWKTEEIAKRKYGVVDPVLPGGIGDDTPFIKMACGMLEVVDCDYLHINGDELSYNCSSLSPDERGLLLAQVVRCISREVPPALFGWMHSPAACAYRRNCETIDGDLDPVDSKNKGLVSYTVLQIGTGPFGVPILRCAATYRKEVDEALGDDALARSWSGVKY
ncbi:hypothetical protein [Candidatus Nanoperiomorbus periodonticus]|jgi:hypothetical protein|uniref:hypothetical protein n=1 Tax=Candidatus Nanoperiomorbus periodonticus TaxID=2171989 RepID=UPI00101B72E6|nr:hypothetical protein [Candidatus Nanoperiomorbus periodonticus]RYC76064.1 hypothetical protein G52EAM_00096 [Candidatus Nanoperiomorbus periodonticus]